MKRSLGVVLGLVVVGVISVVLLNQWDPPLNPEVERILNQKHEYSDNQKHAYFYLLGIHAGETQDPQTRGESLWNKWLAVPANHQGEFIDREFLKKPWHFSRDSKSPEALIESKNSIGQYTRLMEYEETAPLLATAPGAPIHGIVLLPFNAHPFFLLQLAQWLKQGGQARVLELLESSNRYMTSVMNKGVLLERQVAIHNMKANAKFLLEQILINPKLKSQLKPALIDSFTTPDVDSIFNGALDSEMRIMNNIVRSVGVLDNLEITEFPHVISYLADF